MSAEAAHAASAGAQARAPLRETLREHQVKGGKTCLLGEGTDLRCFATLGPACSPGFPS